MEMTNANSLTRESAIQTVQNEVMLNAAYIDGKWMTIEAPATDTADADSYDSNHDSSYDLYDSNSGTIIATTRLCTKVQVEMAVNAASAAYPSWSQTTVSTRASYLNAIAETMEQQFDKLVGLSVLNNGKPIEEAKIDVSDAIACYRYYANLITEQATWSEVSTSESGIRLLKTYAPVGICALIVPWNFPMVTTA
nr:aldehyde dehydrogenase family protein [Psychrobacter glacincola]